MGKLLIRLFIKDYKNVDDPIVREKFGAFAGVIGILSNLILCSMKIIIGLLSASIAIVADGINNLSDASSSVITLIGFKMAGKPEDKNHPYGHARIEYLAGLFVSVIIIIVGLFLIKTSIEKIINPKPLVFTWITILVLILAMGIKLWQNRFYMQISKLISSLTLKATATDSRNDVIATAVVLIGVIFTKCTGIVIDGYLGVAVAVFVIWSGIQLIRETSSPLLGEAPDEDLVKQIVKMTHKYKGVLGLHDLVVHNYGPGKVFASMHIEVDADADLMESHDMIDNIEREIKEALHIEFVVHMDPIKANDSLVKELRKKMSVTMCCLDGVVDLHDLRIVPGPTHTNIIFDLVLASECEFTEGDLKQIAAEAAREINPHYFVVITFDRAYTMLD